MISVNINLINFAMTAIHYVLIFLIIFAVAWLTVYLVRKMYNEYATNKNITTMLAKNFMRGVLIIGIICFTTFLLAPSGSYIQVYTDTAVPPKEAVHDYVSPTIPPAKSDENKSTFNSLSKAIQDKNMEMKNSMQ